MLIETSSGLHYLYDMQTNKIIACEGQGVAKPVSPIIFGNVVTADALPNIDNFILELTQDCNFRCSYCCYGGKYLNNRIHASKEMSEDVLNKSIEFIAQNRVQDRKLNIAFYGGEPLLSFEKIKSFVSKAKECFPKDTEYTISTNGSLLLEDGPLEWCIDNNATINISFDGSEKVSKRMTKGGKCSHAIILNVLETICRNYHEYWESNVNLLVTVSKIDDLIVIARDWDATKILKAKAPYLISGVSPCQLSDYELNEDKVLATLRELLDYFAKNRDNIFIKTYIDMLCSPVIDRQIFPLPSGYSPLMCLPYNTRCYIDADGNLGICEKTPDKLRLGNIFEGWDFALINHAIDKMASERKFRCRECEMFRFCKTCFTNYFYDEQRWAADCAWQSTWNKIAITISLEVLERGLIDSADVQGFTMREMTESDVPALQRIMSKPEVMRYVDGLDIFENYKDSLQFFLLISEINNTFAHLSLFAIVDKKSDLIGVVGIDEITDNAANLFFLLEDDYWGKGIMTKILAEYLQKHVPDTVKTITTHINPGNKAALRLASKFSKIEVSTSLFI